MQIIITAGVFVYSQQATKHYYEMSPGNNEETTGKIIEITKFSVINL